MKLEIHDTHRKDEKITTIFKTIKNEDVVNKAYLGEKLFKMNGHLSKAEKADNEIKLQYNKQSVEEVLVQKAVKTTIQILYDKGLFDINANAEKVLEVFLFTTRRRGDLSERVNDVVQ